MTQNEDKQATRPAICIHTCVEHYFVFIVFSMFKRKTSSFVSERMCNLGKVSSEFPV